MKAIIQEFTKKTNLIDFNMQNSKSSIDNQYYFDYFCRKNLEYSIYNL